MTMRFDVRQTPVSKTFAGFMLSAAFGVGMLSPLPAIAGATQDKVVGIFAATLKAMGAKDVDQEDISGDDAKFTMSNVEIDTGTDTESLTIEEITFIGAKPSADGGITADEVDFKGVDLTADKGGSTIQMVKIKGFVTASPDKIKTPGSSRFERLEATNIEFGDDKLTIPLSYLLMTGNDYINGVPHKGTMEMKGLVVPVKADDPQMAELVALGYKEVNVDASFSGAWDEKAARLTLDNWTISGKDAGIMQLSLALGGVTPDAVKQLTESKGDGNKALGVLQGFLVESAALKIENSGLYQREIDVQAKRQGMKPDELVHQGTAFLPAILASVQNPAFEKKVVDAVNAFVGSPKSLTLKIAPAQPVPVAQILGVAATAPQTLPDVLGVDVTANK